MAFDLAAIARRTRQPRRSRITLRDIVPPATLATDLFRQVYLPEIEVWERAAERIMREYARSLAEITQDSPIDLESLIGEADTEARRLLLVLTPRLRDWTLRVERWFRSKWRGAVLSATGVDLATMIGPEGVRETIQTFVARNVALVKDVSDQARGRIADAVFRGLNARTAAVDVAKEIAEAIGMARRRARNIASHQLSNLSNRLADERRREAGIEKWAWKHSGKQHPRPEHIARDGKVYSDESEPEDLPGELPFCGCRSLGVLEFD